MSARSPERLAEPLRESLVLKTDIVRPVFDEYSVSCLLSSFCSRAAAVVEWRALSFVL